ncbi:MAG TPA: 4Fe-4S binding protein [Sediminispirochaeta sp.]|nr:4Fe-4S binding protein [Sediminispirochaeta sp.]
MAQGELKSMSTTQVVMLLLVFFMMCVLRLWFSLFLLFGFAIVLTLSSGRKNYCAHYCPLGGLQDYYPARSKSRQGPQWLKWMRWPVFVVFWSYLAYATMRSFGDGFALWRSIFLVMVLSMVTALILQTMFRRRYWCSNLCPLGTSVLKGAVKTHRFVTGKNRLRRPAMER